MEGVAAQHARGQLQLLRPQSGKAQVHRGTPGKHAPARKYLAIGGGEFLEQGHHAAALGPDRPARRHMRGDAGTHAGVAGERRRTQLRVAARQPQRVAGGQRGVGQW